MPYKNKRKQKKFAREWTRSKRAGKKWRGASWVPFRGLEAVGKEKIKRKPRILKLKGKGTWLGKSPKYTRAPKYAARNGRKRAEIGGKHSASIRKAMK